MRVNLRIINGIANFSTFSQTKRKHFILIKIDFSLFAFNLSNGVLLCVFASLEPFGNPIDIWKKKKNGKPNKKENIYFLSRPSKKASEIDWNIPTIAGICVIDFCYNRINWQHRNSGLFDTKNKEKKKRNTFEPESAQFHLRERIIINSYHFSCRPSWCPYSSPHVGTEKHAL